MGITHFENGKDLTVQFVNTAVKINQLHTSSTLGATVTRSFQVPINKKWTVSSIYLSRDEPGAIDLYVENPAGQGAKIDGDVTGFDVFMKDVFTIPALWKIIAIFHPSALPGNMYIQYLYNEDPE